MTTNQTVKVSKPRDGVTLLTLNRPERLNAVTFDLVDDLHEALEGLQNDSACRVVVLTGEGRGFCSGIDLQVIGDPGRPAGTDAPEADGRSAAHTWMLSQKHIAALVPRMRQTQQPIIAAVNGPAYGAGMALACACDIRIAADSARFCVGFIKAGVGGCDIAISYTLPRLIGASRAHELMLSGRAFDGAQAHDYGLVCEVVPDSGLLDRALGLAETICSYDQFGVVMTKEVMWANLDAPNVEAAILLENRNQMLTASGGGLDKAATAFAERKH